MAEANKKIKNETETYEKLTKIFTKIKEAEEKAGKTRKECFDHFSVMTKIKEDDNEILKDLYKSFGKSMKELEDARDKHLEKIKGLIIPITQYYPTELKKNKNNLEKIAKAKKAPIITYNCFLSSIILTYFHDNYTKKQKFNQIKIST